MTGRQCFAGKMRCSFVRVQPAGKAAMSGDEWLRGRGLTAGETLD